MARRKAKIEEFDPNKAMYIVEYYCTRECNEKGNWVPSLATQNEELAEYEKMARSKLENAPTRITVLTKH